MSSAGQGNGSTWLAALPSPAVRVIANDKPLDMPDGATAADLLAVLGLDRRWVVMERNGEPVARGDVASTSLHEGDRVELVRAVAGG